MSCLNRTHDWDLPFFKVLANNDTGAAAGHQGGIVIPKDLRVFFPTLSVGSTSSANPTTDRRLRADLFIEDRFVSAVDTRYQFQTWGGTRRAESRLTDQLVPIRSVARGGDILVMQRSIDRLDLYRLTLVRQGSADFAEVLTRASGKRWGVFGSELPLAQNDLDSAAQEEEAEEQGAFASIDTTAGITTSTVKRVARSVVFRESVTRLYAYSCAVCGTALRSPLGMVEVDAAHIIPRSRMGPDDARNGISLCKRHHWAFDGGLFGFRNDLTIIVPSAVGALPANLPLRSLNGQTIRKPSSPSLSPHPDALTWHRDHVLLRD